MICGGVMPRTRDKSRIHCSKKNSRGLLYVNCFEKWHDEHCVVLNKAQ